MSKIPEPTTEVEVYICWELEYPDVKPEDDLPALMRVNEDGWLTVELMDFDVHPMREEILAIANLMGQDEAASQNGSKFSVNFLLPDEWFDGCGWKEA